MFYIRYNIKTRWLTGWDKVKLPLRKGENQVVVEKLPAGDDYEAFLYKNGQIVPNLQKQSQLPGLDFPAELKDLKRRVKALEESERFE